MLLGVLLLARAVQDIPAAVPASSIRLVVEPSEVVAGVLYGGTTIRVSASVPAGYDAAVACVGRTDTVRLRTKKKVFGVLWMNAGDVAFADVPSVYTLSTSQPLEDLGPASTLERLGIGYGALESASHALCQNGREQQLFGELLKLKESEGLYAYDEGGVRLHPGPGGTARLSTVFRLTPKAQAGDYEVRLVGFRNGEGELLDTRRLRIRREGSAAFIHWLAQHHGLLYGVLAVSVALVVGLLTGYVFGLGSRKGH